MNCPKCNNPTLIQVNHGRLQCTYIYPDEYKVIKRKNGTEKIKEIKGQPCGFACGLAFLFDDENIDVRTQVGMSIEELKISPRAKQIIETGILGLNEIDMETEVEKIPAIKEAETKEEEWNELNAMMREVVGRSAGIHKTLTSGESYRKNKGGGLSSKKLG